MSIYENGWNREKVLAAIKKKNGFEICGQKIGETMMCYYRHPHKKQACLVGVFIPDNFHKLDRVIDTNQSVALLIDDYPELMDYMPLSLVNMASLQQLHDQFNSPDYGVGNDHKTLEEAVVHFLDKLEGV